MVRTKGQCHISDLTADVPTSVHIDSLYLSNPAHTVPVLAANFHLYEKFFVHSVALEFVPSQPVTVGGTVSIAPDYDPLDPMPESAAALSSSQGFKSGPVTSGMKCVMPNYKGPDGGYTRPELFSAPTNDDRLTSFGQFKLFGVAPTLTRGDVIGKLILHYDITFHILEPSARNTFIASTVDRLVCVGTATTFMPTDVVSTTISDGITMNTSGGVATQNIGHLLTGIISEIGTGLNAWTAAGRAINEGTRIFFRPVKANIATTSYSNFDTSAYVGQLSTSRNFNPMSNIVTNLVNTVAIMLAGVQYV